MASPTVDATQSFRSKSGSLAKFTAIRIASSLVRSFPTSARPRSLVNPQGRNHACYNVPCDDRKRRRKSCDFLCTRCILPSRCQSLFVAYRAPKRRRRLRRPGGQCQCSVLPTLKAYSEARPSPRTTFVFRLRGDALAQLRSVRRYVVFNSTGRSARL
jgi:hypothetical protein